MAYKFLKMEIGEKSLSLYLDFRQFYEDILFISKTYSRFPCLHQDPGFVGLKPTEVD